MEIFFVYGLVLIFFIALPFVIIFVMKEPAREPTAEELARSSHKAANKAKVSFTPSNIAAYGLLTAIFALLFVVTMLTQRGRAA